MDKKNKFKKLLPMILMFAVSVAIGITGATVLHTLRLENPVKTPTVEGEVKEEDLTIGGKKISFVNTGEADVLVRASISESWIYTDENNKTQILPNKVGDVKVAVPFGNIANPTGTGSAIVLEEGCDDGWLYNPADGWYYYRKVLPGSRAKGENEAEKKTKLLVEGVNFKFNEINDKRYEKAVYELHCTMEVVQASDKVELTKKAANALFNWEPKIANEWGTGKYGCSFDWGAPTVSDESDAITKQSE